MRFVTSLQPFDRIFAAAPSPRGRLELGAIVAASGRRPGTAAKAFGSAPASKARPGKFGPWAWIMAGLAVWTILVAGRGRIVRLVPAAAPFYSAVGLGVNWRRMDIEHVASRLVDEDGRRILVVEGEIRNLDQAPRAAPRMRFSVLDGGGREVYFWIAAPPKARLLAGETAQFRARLAAPPEEGREVRARFAAEPETK